MERNGWIKLLAVVVVIVVVSVTLWVVYYPEEEGNPDLIRATGLEADDQFEYDITGTINGTAVHGSFEWSVYQGPSSWTWGPVNTTDQALADVMAHWNGAGTDIQVGHGVIDTAFGPKQVVWTFGFDFAWSGSGLATIAYYGTDPVVEYGFVINGPDLHLDLALEETNNERVKHENLRSFSWQSVDYPEWDHEETGGGWLDHSTRGQVISLNDPGRMEFNITGDDADVFVFSNSHMVSMAEGGPFAFLMGASMTHMGTYAGETAVPSGLTLVYFRESGDEGGRYDFTIEDL